MDKKTSYLSYVEQCVKILMEQGTDRYGKIHTPMLVSILDVETRTCPEVPEALDEYFRVTRRGRRSPAGSNLLTDQPTLRAMYTLSEVTGKRAYAECADRYAGYVMQHLVDAQGFFWWGWHRHYDVFKDSREGHNPNMAKWGETVLPHEFHAMDISWDRLWAVDSGAVARAIEAIWEWHVIDKQTGEPNRHGDGTRGCDFSMSGGGCVEAFAFMYIQTKAGKWLERARLVADYYWSRRNPDTDLLPDRPNAGKHRFDGGCFVTSTTGLYCRSLLKAYELTQERSFLDQALAYLQAYAQYGYDEKTGKFWGALTLDGSPIPGPRAYADNVDSAAGYAAAQPRGHLELWGPYVAGYEYPIYTAEAFTQAAGLTGDAEMLTAAERFADWIRKTPPGKIESVEKTWYSAYTEGAGKEGTYADKYGRTVSFLLRLYVLTGERRYLGDARSMADAAIARLLHNGLFRGHPAKPYYEAMDGVGHLLYALLQLDRTLLTETNEREE